MVAYLEKTKGLIRLISTLTIEVMSRSKNFDNFHKGH